MREYHRRRHRHHHQCKIMLQAEPRGTLPYSGFIDCLQKINAEGGVSLLYRGGAVLAVRGAFFTAGQMLGYGEVLSERAPHATTTQNLHAANLPSQPPPHHTTQT